jgi:hypothetical protein
MRSVYLAHACIYTRQLTYSRIRVVPFFEFIMRFEFLLIYILATQPQHTAGVATAVFEKLA